MEKLSASVRPIVTFALTAGYLGGAGYLVFEAVQKGDFDTAKEIFTFASPPVVAIFGYYFGDRSARKAAQASV